MPVCQKLYILFWFCFHLTYMYFCLKCVGHEICYYYVNDVIVRVFNLNCYLTLIVLLCIYSVLCVF